ncbi:hypothetical protein Xen7305DRAFT_00034180, partial [Xenococcus sp. PCC 7305]
MKYKEFFKIVSFVYLLSFRTYSLYIDWRKIMSFSMIGTQRSGSNLLRLMINQIDGLAAPHPPHILKRLMPLVGNYGDLQNKANFRVLVDDVCRLVELNPVVWEGVILDREDVFNRCQDNSLVAVFSSVYD